MDIHILCPFLLWDQAANQFIHVIGPTMTKVMQQVFEDKIQFNSKEAPMQEESHHYQEQLQHFYKYIDSCQDFFKHKFLVFIYNDVCHWTAIVVVISFLVFDCYKYGRDLNVHEDNYIGCCVIDSLGGGSTQMKHEYLTETSDSKYDPKFGIHLFLNYCASLLKGRSNWQTLFSYKQPFEKEVGGIESFPCSDFLVSYKEPSGDYKDVRGTESFPHFDFCSPSFI